MTVADLVETLRARDIRLWLEGGRVRVNAPAGALTPELQSQLSARKEDLLRFLAEQSAQASAAAADAADTEHTYPASFAQRGLWFINHLEPTSTAYNMCASTVLDTAIELPALERAINAVVRRQGALRTVFREVNGEPVQVVEPFRPRTLEVVDLTALPVAERELQAQRLKREEAAQPFDLAAGPLFRVKLLKLDAERHILLFSMHHIVCDGWSLGIFLEELSAQYDALRAEAVATSQPLTMQYGDYAARERASLQGPTFEKLLDYWRTRLAGAPPLLDLPTDRPRPAVKTFNGTSLPFSLSPALSASLRALARREGATLYMTLLAAFQVMLSRYTGQTDVVVGSPVANRDTADLEHLVGLFVNTLPVRTDLAADPTGRQLIAQVRTQVLEDQAHQALPFEKMVEALRPDRTMAYSPLFQVVFALQSMPVTSPIELTMTAAMYDLSFFVRDASTGVFGAIEYNTDLFDAPTIERMLEHFRTIAEALVASPDIPVSRLPMLSAAERQRVLFDWNATATSYPRDASLLQLFDAVVAERADAVALDASHPISAPLLQQTRFTYAELQRASRRLATWLQKMGVTPGAKVALYMERAPAAIVAILSTLRAGAAYVPLDVGNPTNRIAEILRDADIKIVLTQRSLSAKAPRKDVTVLTIEDGWLESDGLATPAEVAAEATSLAYVMFTSGTTGRPKGVCVTHRNIIRLVRDTNFISVTPQDVMLQFAPLPFDASTLEIWGALLSGATLIVHPQRVPSAAELAETLTTHKISLLWLTAGFFHHMVESEPAALAQVRQVFAGGDVLSVPHVQKLLSAKSDGVVVNGYGPTENTTFTCCHMMPAGATIADTVPIGRPIANTRVYILDASNEPTAIGVAGELYAAGDGVAAGYLGDAERTAQKFLPDPFHPGGTMYRTGDLARWRGDGVIEFLGRADRQVKVRGFRIELEEVEHAMRSAPRVRDAAVVARRDATGTNVLTGYMVAEPGAEIDEGAVREFLVQSLPEYMIPAALMKLPAFPLTANGKLDRAALPLPASSTKGSQVTEPRSAIETQLLTIWESVLGHSGFGIRANFFELGGHSLLAVRMFAQVEQVFGRRLPTSALFQAPTVELLAARLESAGFRAPWNSLVAIQSGGSRPPLFVVPGIGGNVVGYAELARNLGPDQPLYGLQSRGLDGNEEPFEAVEPMAAHYVGEIRKLQPKGPYYLGGACFGGAVAWEMAQQLRAAGEDVAFLLLLETWPPPKRRAVRHALFRQSQYVRFIGSSVKRNVLSLLQTPPSEIIRALRDRLAIVAEIIKRRDVYRGDSAAMYVDAVSTANYKAFSRYQPLPYDGNVMLVLAAERDTTGTERDPRLMWGDLARGGFVEHRIPARDSGLVLKMPHVRQLASLLQSAMRSHSPTRKVEVASSADELPRVSKQA